MNWMISQVDQRFGHIKAFLVCVLVLCVILASAFLAKGAPPTFTVENKCPPSVLSFSVENKIPSGTSGTDEQRYNWLVQSVEAGRAGVMIVGPHSSLQEYIHQEKFPSGFRGFSDGVYDCFARDNPDGTRTAMMQMRKEVSPKANPFPQSRIMPDTIAPSVEGVNTSRLGTDPSRGATYTLAPWGIRGGTMIGNCPPSG